MKTACAVIGANYGDEGKGAVTDWLAHRRGAQAVVRFNGGAQAGHTVVTPGGWRHVFHHFGSGTLLGVPTVLSRFFVANPALFAAEYAELAAKAVFPVVYADPLCLVTTPLDMMLNQRLEESRGAGRHGSCGVGVNETVRRSEAGPAITVADLRDRHRLRSLLARAYNYYLRELDRLGFLHDDEDTAFDRVLLDRWLDDAAHFRDAVRTTSFFDHLHPLVFEGAQGLLLDQGNDRDFPYLTRSNTGLRNVLALAPQFGVTDVEAWYVSRTYLTRHGAGPLPCEEPWPAWLDDATNVENEWQGRLRYAAIDAAEATALEDRVSSDAAALVGEGTVSVHRRLAFTWCDKLAPPDVPHDAEFRGPTRDHATFNTETRRSA